MIVSIMQPAYLPWLGYFHRILSSDLHVVLDHVQLDTNSKTRFTNRNKVRTPEGWTWLTVPLLTKGKRGSLEIDKLETDEASRWREKHWRSLVHCYSRSAHFAEHAPFFEAMYGRPWPLLRDVMRESTDYLLRRGFGIETPFRYSSEMKLEARKDDLILDICVAVGATSYLSGPFGRDYLDASKFRTAGIELRFHDYRHPEYRQAFEGFEPFMSAVDLVFNHGPDSKALLGPPGEGMSRE
jgi:hypothetical protein